MPLMEGLRMTEVFLKPSHKDSPPLENISLNLLPSIGDYPTGPSRNYRELLEIIPNHIEQSLNWRLLNSHILERKQDAKLMKTSFLYHCVLKAKSRL